LALAAFTAVMGFHAGRAALRLSRSWGNRADGAAPAVLPDDGFPSYWEPVPRALPPVRGEHQIFLGIPDGLVLAGSSILPLAQRDVPVSPAPRSSSPSSFTTVGPYTFIGCRPTVR
jgi:hypothetical protein